MKILSERNQVQIEDWMRRQNSFFEITKLVPSLDPTDSWIQQDVGSREATIAMMIDVMQRTILDYFSEQNQATQLCRLLDQSE